MFSNVHGPISLLAAYESSGCFTSWLILGISHLLKFGHSVGCVVSKHIGFFNLNFPDNWQLMSFFIRLLVIWISFLKCLFKSFAYFLLDFFSFSYQFAKVLYIFWILLLYVLQIFFFHLVGCLYFLSSVFSWVEVLNFNLQLTLKQHKFELYGSTCTEFFSILTQVVLCLQSMVDWILRKQNPRMWRGLPVGL